MKGKFLKNFAIIGGGTLISMIIGFLTTPIITRIVDPTEYGQFSIFTLYANIAVMILYLGLDQSLVRYFYDKETDEYRRGLLYKCVRIPIMATVVVVTITFISACLEVWEFELGKIILFLLCIYTFIQIVFRFSLLLVRLQYKTKLYSTLGIIQKVTYVVIALPLVWLGIVNNVIALVLGTMLAAMLCMVISIMAERRLWKFNLIKKVDCEVSSKALLLYAYPYVLSMGVTTLFQAIDKISLNMYGTYADVGIYSSTMTLVNIFSIIQTSFNALWAPMAVEHYTKNRTDKTFYQKGNQVITVVMFFIGISLILCKDVFAILLGEKYRQAAYILPFLIFNPIMYTISETTVNGLVFLKKSKMQVAVALVACLTNIIGNTLLVPKYGCQGAAISTGISYIVFFTMRTVLSNRYFYVDFKLKKFYLLTFTVVLYALYNTFVHFNAWSIVGFFICLAVLVFAYSDTLIWGIQYGTDLLKDMIKKD